jgi:hypothetical protein
MANPTTQVNVALTGYDDNCFYWPLRSGSDAAKTYQTGQMIGKYSNGYAGDFDDATDDLVFLGIVDGHPVQVDSGDAAGAKLIRLRRPQFIEIPLASGTASKASHIGSTAYAYDAGKAALSGTTYANVIGYIKDVKGTGMPNALTGALLVVAPPAIDNIAGAGQLGANASVTDLTLTTNITFDAASTGDANIAIPDNQAAALTIKEASNAYVTFVTTNSGEKVVFSKAVDMATTLTFTGATGVNKILVQDNLASALVIGEGSNAYMTFVSTNSGEKITVAKDIASSKGFTSSAPTGVGIGYATGAGGAVTQATDRTTGVTLNTLTGQITTNNASLAAGAEAEFTVTNSTVAATDTIVLNITPGGTGTPFAYVSTVGSGSFKVTVTNLHASTADTSADVINFTVIKGVAA